MPKYHTLAISVNFPFLKIEIILIYKKEITFIVYNNMVELSIKSAVF